MDQVIVIKVVTALLYPLGLVFIFAIMAWLLKLLFFKRLAISCRLLSLAILLLASNPMVARWAMESLEHQNPQVAIQSIEKHQAILVLGGGLRLPIPPALRPQIGSGSDRFWHAVQLYRAGKADKIVLAGGNVYAQTGIQGEAYYAADLLQQWGVPKSAIVVESSSRTTEQNRNNIQAYFESRDIRSVLLVSSAYHMPRALQLFEPLALKITPASADVMMLRQSSPAIFNWIPSSAAISLNTIAAHEYYGMWFTQLKAFIATF